MTNNNLTLDAVLDRLDAIWGAVQQIRGDIDEMKQALSRIEDRVTVLELDLRIVKTVLLEHSVRLQELSV